MSFEKYTKTDQPGGGFDKGKILENKPLGFQQDGGKLKPYSNIFYWANAWSDEGGLIAEHPHRGFEIMSVVLKGTISHFDSEHKSWVDLNKGDVQIIRSGMGISHAEKFLKGARIFQIWFDPDLEKTWFKSPSYSNYNRAEFPILKSSNKEVVTIKGDQSPLSMDTPNIGIQFISFSTGVHEMDFDPDFVYSIYMIKGKMNVNEKTSLSPDDFLIVRNEKISKLIVQEDSEIFVIKSPERIQYRTFAELFD